MIDKDVGEITGSCRCGAAPVLIASAVIPAEG
jgi:hypothetical protein